MADNGGKVWYKSKTIWFNAVLGATVAFCLAIGYPLPEEVVAAIVTLGNIILRMLTTEAVTSSSSK
jgi:hypothetical protein